MNKKIVTLGSILVLVLLSGCYQNIEAVKEVMPVREYNTPSLTTEDVVTEFLEDKGYSVIWVVEGNDEELGDYASVNMEADAGDTLDIAYQLGTGFGVLYGAWEYEDWYMVSLTTGDDVCTFGIEYDTMISFVNDRITEEELFGAMVTTCN